MLVEKERKVFGGRRCKYKRLLEDEKIRRWYSHAARGAEVTADVYLRRLGCICNEHKIKFHDLLDMSDDDLITMINDLITDMEIEGYAGSYIESNVKAIKSWLKFNRRKIEYEFRINGARDTPSLADERAPTQPELRKIFLMADIRERVSSVLVAHSGYRPQVQGYYRGTDGLMVSDLPGMIVDNASKSVEFKKIPTMVIVRAPISKAGHQYFTFLSDEGCDYLKEYLEKRMRNGEILNGKSPIIIPDKYSDFMYATSVSDIIRRAIRRAGFSWRPYVLRSYFDMQMMLAESKGLILRDYRVFFMGHKGDIEHTYTVNKKQLPEHIVEDMREAYKRASQYLVTVHTQKSEDMSGIFIKKLLVASGYTHEEIEKMDIANIDDQKLQNLVKEKLLGSMVNNGMKQKVVHVEEVEKYIATGWEFVSTLGNGKAIVRLP